MDRLLIVAFDGLEASLVEEWKLSSLLQRKYGRYSVGKEYFSPDLWSAFLTGRNPQVFKSKFIERRTPSFLKKRAFPKSIKKLGRKFFKPEAPTVRGSYNTIFDNVDRSLPFNVFCYNELENQLELRLKYGLPNTVGNMKRSLQAYKDWLLFSKKQFLSFLNLLHSRDWKFAMTHFFFTDYIGHLFFWKKHHFRINYAYLIANRFMDQLTREIKDSLILIVSDHGMSRGEHTEYGFWSFNKEVEWQPRNITDFYLQVPKLIS